jgi:ATP-dependent RNA helicase RhlE
MVTNHKCKTTRIRRFQNKEVGVLWLLILLHEELILTNYPLLSTLIYQIPETYVHRIGRTGRAGNGGIAISFCSKDEHTYWKDIQNL